MDQSSLEVLAISGAEACAPSHGESTKQRRPYVAPTVTAFGSVEDFTRKGGSRNFDVARTTKNKG